MGLGGVHGVHVCLEALQIQLYVQYDVMDAVIFMGTWAGPGDTATAKPKRLISM